MFVVSNFKLVEPYMVFITGVSLKHVVQIKQTKIIRSVFVNAWRRAVPETSERRQQPAGLMESISQHNFIRPASFMQNNNTKLLMTETKTNLFVTARNTSGKLRLYWRGMN